MKKIFTAFFLGLIVYPIFGQDTLYFDNESNRVESLKTASFYKIIEENKEHKNHFIERNYYTSGQIKSEFFYVLNEKEVKMRYGKATFWYETGELKNEIHFENGVWDGELLSYWKNGNLKRKDYYKKGKLKNGECWDENGKLVKHYDFQIPAKFPGGINQLHVYLKENFKYPPQYNYKIRKIIKVKFRINTDGSVYNIEILDGINTELNEEAIRLIQNMPKWYPAYQDGNPVSVSFTLPIGLIPNQ